MRHVLFGVAVEAGGDHHQLRAEPFQRRQPVLGDGCPEFGALGAGRQRGVDQVFGFGLVAGERVERMLERRAEQDARVVSEDLLGAVAVVDVEIDDRHALQAMLVQRVGRAYRNVVEDAKAHGARAFGVMARRAHAAERGVGAVVQHQVHAAHGCAGRAPGGDQRVPGHHRVAIVQADHCIVGRDAGDDPVDIAFGVHARQVFARGQRRLEMLDHGIQARGDQPILDRRQALGRFRVMRRDPVSGAIGVRDECECHTPIVHEMGRQHAGSGQLLDPALNRRRRAS